MKTVKVLNLAVRPSLSMHETFMSLRRLRIADFSHLHIVQLDGDPGPDVHSDSSGKHREVTAYLLKDT